MVEVHFYGGSLRRYIPQCGPAEACTVQVQPQPGETVGNVLARLGIPVTEVYHAFLNGKLLWTRNSMAPYLGYPQAQAGRVSQGPEADTPVRDGDRLGLFGRDMALLVV